MPAARFTNVQFMKFCIGQYYEAHGRVDFSFLTSWGVVMGGRQMPPMQA